MPSALVLVSSREGQAAKIARRIAEGLHQAHVQVALRDVARPDPAAHLARFDGIVIGGSIHYGHHAPALRELVKNHRTILRTRHSAFFSVSLAAGGPARNDEQARRYLEEFAATTGWSPDQAASFGGAVRPSKYGFLKALMVRITLARAGHVVAGEHEYTDWSAVEAFAGDFARRLAVGKRESA